VLLHAYRDRFTHLFMIDGAHPSEDTIRRVLKLLPERISREQINTVLKLTSTNRRELGSVIRVLAQAGVATIEGTPPHGLVTINTRTLHRDQIARALVSRERELVRLQRMQAYAYHGKCRRTFVLDYFGAKFAASACSGCDNCNDRSYLKDVARPASEFKPQVFARMSSFQRLLHG
jgi:ATP-dependent DNA helicase RecQ